MHVICGESEYTCTFACHQQQRRSQQLNRFHRIRKSKRTLLSVLKLERANSEGRRCAESENFYGSALPKSCTVEVNLWWKDNVLWEEKTWKSTPRTQIQCLTLLIMASSMTNETNDSNSKRNDEKSERQWKNEGKTARKNGCDALTSGHIHRIYIYSFKWRVYIRDVRVHSRAHAHTF